MKDVRHALSDAIGRKLTLSEMAKLCGLKDWARRPDGRPGNGRETYREWEDGDGPPGPVAMLLALYAAGLRENHYAGCYETIILDIIRERLDA